MLSTGCLIWLLTNYHVPSPLGFSHSSHCESSSNSRSIWAFAFASCAWILFCRSMDGLLPNFIQISVQMSPSLWEALWPNVIILRPSASLCFLTLPYFSSQHSSLSHLRGISWFLASTNRMYATKQGLIPLYSCHPENSQMRSEYSGGFC